MIIAVEREKPTKKQRRGKTIKYARTVNPSGEFTTLGRYRGTSFSIECAKYFATKRKGQ